MVVRILLLLVLAWIVWRLFRRAVLRGKSAERPAISETWVVACAHCGIHVPQGETVADAAGRRYCSEAHRQLGEKVEPS